MALPLSTPGLVFEACGFAAVKHRDQRRKDAHASPFINHPIEAARLLATVGGVADADVLTAAVLHDVLENTSTTPAEIERAFGQRVRRLVEDVTDPPGLPRDERRRRQLERVRLASPSARQIRLADKVANLTALPHGWDAAERRQYLTWMGAMDVALRGTNTPLEALFAERLRQAWAQTHASRPVPVPPAPAVPRVPPLAESATDLVKVLARLQSQLSSAEEMADLIASMLETRGIRVVTRPGKETVATDPPRNPRRRTRRFSDPKLRELAKAGVGTVRLRPGRGRKVAIAIDGAPEFESIPSVAALLQVFLLVEGQAEDGFPPFLPNPELAARLRALTGRPASERAVVVGISRLRERLQDFGHVSPLLVETAAKRGARFRIRRTTAS